MMNIDIENDSVPILALAAVAFMIIMAVPYGAAIMSNITEDTGVLDAGINIFNMFNLWVITISSVILIMILIIGLYIVRKKH